MFVFRIFIPVPLDLRRHRTNLRASSLMGDASLRLRMDSLRVCLHESVLLMYRPPAGSGSQLSAVTECVCRRCRSRDHCQ